MLRLSKHVRKGLCQLTLRVPQSDSARYFIYTCDASTYGLASAVSTWLTLL